MTTVSSDNFVVLLDSRVHSNGDSLLKAAPKKQQQQQVEISFAPHD